MVDPILAEDFQYLASLLRNAIETRNEANLRALMSNNFNTIIHALEVAAEAMAAPEYGVDTERELATTS